MESTFSLELSFAELRWLAGAFSIANLPLVLPTVTPDALHEAQKTLQNRGLIKSGETAGWQVDPFIALSLQWMVGARQFWVFEQFLRVGQTFEIALFLMDGTGMLVLPLAGGKRLMVCRNMDTILAEWQLSSSLPPQTKSTDSPEWDVPQPLTIIRSTWKNPRLAQTMASPDFLTWASGLDWVGEWVLVTEGKRFSRLVLTGCGSDIWAGRYTPGRPGEFPLRGFNQTELKQILIASA